MRLDEQYSGIVIERELLRVKRETLLQMKRDLLPITGLVLIPLNLSLDRYLSKNTINEVKSFRELLNAKLTKEEHNMFFKIIDNLEL